MKIESYDGLVKHVKSVTDDPDLKLDRFVPCQWGNRIWHVWYLRVVGNAHHTAGTRAYARVLAVHRGCVPENVPKRSHL